jgi:hypothetical protein
MADGYTKITFLPIKTMQLSAARLGCEKSQLPLTVIKSTSLPQGGEVEYGPSYDDWRIRQAAHEDITTTAQGHLERVFYRPGTAQAHIDCSKSGNTNVAYDYLEGNLCYPYQRFVGAPALTDDLVTEADNKAKTAFMHDMVDASTRFQSLVALGEFGENVRMMAYAGKQFHDAVYKWKQHTWDIILKGHVPSSKVALHAAVDASAATWLELAFGYQPTVNDIDSAMMACYEELDKGYTGITGTAIRAKGHSAESIATAHRTAYNGLFRFDYSEEAYNEADVVYRGYYAGSPYGNPDPWQYWGFKIEDLLPTVYELTPYTWLIDYFSNLGDIVTALSYWRSGLKWTNVTRRSAGVVRHKGYKVQPRSSYDYYTPKIDSFLAPHFVSRASNWDRASYLGNFIPDVHFKIPGTSMKWATITSLAWLKGWKLGPVRTI